MWKKLVMIQRGSRLQKGVWQPGKKISCFPGNYFGRRETGKGGGRRAASKQQLLA